MRRILHPYPDTLPSGQYCSTCSNEMEIHQMDVKTMFLNGVVEAEVYVEHPLDFETHDRETHVCKLKKSMYGLKHTPGHGTIQLTYSNPVWALPRVKQIPTFTTRLNIVTP